MRWGPRTIDLDLLLFGKKEIHDAGLVVPHPRLAERLFVLVPLAEIAGSVVVPGATSTVRELRARLGRVCTDRVERVRTPAP